MPPAAEVGVITAGSWCLLAGLLETGRKGLRHLAAIAVRATGAASRAGEALACLGDAAAARLLLWSAADRQAAPAVPAAPPVPAERPGPFEPAPRPDGPAPVHPDDDDMSAAELTAIDAFPAARAGSHLGHAREWE